ncbi:hypothetical protein Tco_0539026, partial [Tanacetum coccineum]
MGTTFYPYPFPWVPITWAHDKVGTEGCVSQPDWPA